MKRKLKVKKTDWRGLMQYLRHPSADGDPFFRPVKCEVTGGYVAPTPDWDSPWAAAGEFFVRCIPRGSFASYRGVADAVESALDVEVELED